MAERLNWWRKIRCIIVTATQSHHHIENVLAITIIFNDPTDLVIIQPGRPIFTQPVRHKFIRLVSHIIKPLRGHINLVLVCGNIFNGELLCLNNNAAPIVHPRYNRVFLNWCLSWISHCFLWCPEEDSNL